MRILDRYLLRQVLPPMIWCVLTFVGLTVIIDLFGHLDEIMKHHVSLEQLFVCYAHFVPTVFVQTLPMSLLLASAFTLGRLNRHNEITAMRASGISIWGIVLPFLLAGLLATAVSFAVNETLVPQTSREFERLKAGLFDAAPTETVLLHHVAVFGSNNRLIHASAYDVEQKTLDNITVLEHDRANHLTGKVTARSAKWVEGQWIFYDGVVYRLNAIGQLEEQPVVFQAREIALGVPPEEFAKPEARPEHLGYRELRQYLDRMSTLGLSQHYLRRFLVELHSRLAFPVVNFVMVLLGIPFALRHTRGGFLTGVGLSIGFGVVYYGVMAVSLALGTGGLFTPWAAAWLPHLGFTGVGLWLVGRQG